MNDAMTDICADASIADSVAYPYSQGDLLAEKPVYNFSAFRGSPFLRGYAASRRTWLEGLPPAPAANRTPSSLAGDGTVLVRSSSRLADILERLVREGVPDEGDRTSFQLLLQRFEVTKRLFTHVDERFRPTSDADPADLKTYALFGLAALLMNRTAPHLSLVNAALKAHDIVTSQDPSVMPTDTMAVARRGIALELEAVTTLAAKAGVAL